MSSLKIVFVVYNGACFQLIGSQIVFRILFYSDVSMPMVVVTSSGKIWSIFEMFSCLFFSVKSPFHSEHLNLISLIYSPKNAIHFWIISKEPFRQLQKQSGMWAEEIWASLKGHRVCFSVESVFQHSQFVMTTWTHSERLLWIWTS